ncbi:Imm7 family immunity protein [Nocardia stercoris]|uniref:Immunity protein 7 n=1 Tax=Nocardia stercoris TaxID=2483361 RepID=A0A3M2KQ06_9NOCA|nr:Imm7 family immunity protein [Nocardia stercoris]RMI27747.1 hypothetical protein EBN03_33060 [Nocardia stercoris]
MFEYHGWVHVLSTPEAIDPEPPLPLTEIRDAVEKLAGTGLVDLRAINGELHLHLGGYADEADHRPAELMREIGRLAPGSYGLLYIHDDEDTKNDNSFQVYRLARGWVTEHADWLLSPIVPALEDAWDE